jgi:hypothetical protein
MLLHFIANRVELLLAFRLRFDESDPAVQFFRVSSRQ